MIKNSEPLSMAEALEYTNNEEESEIVGFIKKFNKLQAKDARELRSGLENLNMMKVRAESIVKIIDILPENQEELNKIFIDVTLEEDEAKKILELVKQFK